MFTSVYIHQGEEGPPSLEYIKAKDLFPQKELVKEDESLQVSRTLYINHSQPLPELSPMCSDAKQHVFGVENHVLVTGQSLALLEYRLWTSMFL